MQGEIKHLYRGFAFISSKLVLENGGVFVSKTKNLVLAGGGKVGCSVIFLKKSSVLLEFWDFYYSCYYYVLLLLLLLCIVLFVLILLLMQLSLLILAEIRKRMARDNF